MIQNLSLTALFLLSPVEAPTPSTSPLIESTCKPNTQDDCIYRGPFRDEIEQYNFGPMYQIYLPYWNCYNSSIFENPLFESEVSTEIQSIFQSAYDKCSEERMNSNVKAENFLASDYMYGDVKNRRIVAEKFRKENGQIMTLSAFSRSGKMEVWKKWMKALSAQKNESDN